MLSFIKLEWNNSKFHKFIAKIFEHIDDIDEKCIIYFLHYFPFFINKNSGDYIPIIWNTEYRFVALSWRRPFEVKTI